MQFTPASSPARFIGWLLNSAVHRCTVQAAAASERALQFCCAEIAWLMYLVYSLISENC